MHMLLHHFLRMAREFDDVLGNLRPHSGIKRSVLLLLLILILYLLMAVLNGLSH